MRPRPSALAALLSAAALLAAPRAGAQAPGTVPPGLDAYVDSVRAAFGVPGVAVAIVQDGRVVLAKGYGERRPGERAPVDERTLFGIASNTKAFTATALGMLVEEGKLEWDAPVVRYLPWFALSDPYVTRELTVRDLLVHRSGLGLGGGDLLWWPATTYSRREISERLRHVPLATSFRSAYAYDNVLYVVAGELIQAVSGQSWEDFVSARILRPLGMADSHAGYPPPAARGALATPHAPVEGRVRPVAPYTSAAVNPGGGIHSSARDMARWMAAQLDSGRVRGGGRLWSRPTARALWTLVTPRPVGDPPAELPGLRRNFYGYGLGFDLQDFHGRKLVSHTGGYPGYFSKVAMIPDLKVGVAVLTSQESGAAFEAITYRVLDHYLGAPRADYLGAYRRSAARGDSAVAAALRTAATARDSASGPSLPLERYAGTYTDPWYGDVVIARENGRLAIRFGATPALVGDLEHWQHDTFVARWRDRELRADAFLTFALNPDGSIDQARMRPVSSATDFSFDFQDLVLRPARPARPR